jgi:phenylacetate-CoA ligase
MRYFNEAIETMSLPKLRQQQSRDLKHQTAYLYEKVPFYRQKMDELGINPSDIKGIEDIHKLPFTKKTDLRDNYPFGLLAVPQDQINRIHCSSGTTGKPTVVAYTKHDLSIFSEVVARSLVASGCQKGWKLQNAYGYGLFTGGLGLHGGAELLGMGVVPVSGGMTDRQLMLMQDFQTDAICCTPSYAQTLAEEIKRRNIPLSNLNLKTAILGAEPWTDTIRQEIERGLGVKAVNIYGLSEIIGPGVSNEDFEEQGTGSYVWEDHFFPEIVDKNTGEPVPYGQQGVLVFTTLTKTGMPFLRYWTGDICHLTYEFSEKRTHVKMGQIVGRADDMLIIRGVNLFHTQIEDVLKDIEHASAYYQLIVTRDGTMDEVEVKIEVDATLLNKLGVETVTPETLKQHPILAQLHHNIGHKIKENIGLSMHITLTHFGAIPRSEGGKLSRIVDLRKK